MAGSVIRSYSLVRRGDAGLACDEDGVALGPVVLARRIDDAAGERRYRLRPIGEVGVALHLAYGPTAAKVLERQCQGLVRITRLLENGADALARIYAVLLGFPEIAPAGMAKLEAAAALRKFNPDWEDEPRVPAANPDGGQWTNGGSGEGGPRRGSSDRTPTSGAVVGGIAAEAVGTAESLFGELSADTIAGLEAIGSRFSGPVAFLSTIFIPTNSSLTATGKLPGQPDVDYHFDRDTGHLLLYRNGELLFDGMPGPDGLFHGTDGRPFGRAVSGSIVLDPSLLSAVAARQEPPWEWSRTWAPPVAANSNQPVLCPAPTADWPHGASKRANAYQTQITGLPPGLGVMLNGVVFDGCRESDGTMLEAKGLAYAWAMKGPNRFMINYKGRQDIMDEAERQSRAAVGRVVEWHFAEKPVADYFRWQFMKDGLSNLVVIYTPYSGGE